MPRAPAQTRAHRRLAPYAHELGRRYAEAGLGAPLWVGGLPKPLSIALTALYVVQMGVLFRQVGRFGWIDALLYPVHAVFVTGVLAVGLVRTHVLRRVAWRGRSYGGSGTRPPEVGSTGG